MKGLPMSALGTPQARNSPRLPARARPFLTISERMGRAPRSPASTMSQSILPGQPSQPAHGDATFLQLGESSRFLAFVSVRRGKLGARVGLDASHRKAAKRG